MWCDARCLAAAALLTSLLVAGPAGAATAGTAPPAPAAPAAGRVFLVQALPGTSVSLSVDGAPRRDEITTGDVVGPLPLSSGEHTLTVTGTDPGWSMEASVDVVPGHSLDVVLHRSASGAATPVVTTYRDPLSGVPADTGRVLVAHTAAAPAADVELDGEVAFADVANGEFATANVPAGNHQVRVLPAGRAAPVLLGPIDLDTPAETLTAVYAFGDPATEGMDVVVHRQQLTARGSSAPAEIATGNAGLVSGVLVAGVPDTGPRRRPVRFPRRRTRGGRSHRSVRAGAACLGPPPTDGRPSSPRLSRAKDPGGTADREARPRERAGYGASCSSPW